MNVLDLDFFLLGMIAAGVIVTAVFGYMIMAPRNDDEEAVRREQRRERPKER